MSQEIDYAIVLADLESRRAALDAAIAGVKAILGQGPMEALPGGSGTITPTPHTGTELKDVTPGVFHGMSVSEAAKKYLEMKKTKQKTRAICDALLQGGIESGARDFYSNVYTTLARTKDFIKLGKYWALATWHPTRAVTSQTKPHKKARRRKPRAERAKRVAAAEVASSSAKAESA